MFKMCFRTHRTQKNILENIYIFFVNNEKLRVGLSNFFDVPLKKYRKKCMFKICFRTHRIQKIGLKINFFFRVLWLEQRWGNFGRGKK